MSWNHGAVKTSPPGVMRHPPQGGDERGADGNGDLARAGYEENERVGERGDLPGSAADHFEPAVPGMYDPPDPGAALLVERRPDHGAMKTCSRKQAAQFVLRAGPGGIEYQPVEPFGGSLPLREGLRVSEYQPETALPPFFAHEACLVERGNQLHQNVALRTEIGAELSGSDASLR